MSGVTLFGVPIDCVGEPVGTVRTPDVLRDAGVVDALGAHDLGDLDVFLGPPQRDPVTGIVGSDSVLDLTRTVRQATTDALDDAGTLVVLGGCCTLQVGVTAGVRDRHPDAALVFLDGHMDLYDGVSSVGGEAADMPVAVLLGGGPRRGATWSMRPCWSPATCPSSGSAISTRHATSARSRPRTFPA
jgi:arginase